MAYDMSIKLTDIAGDAKGEEIEVLAWKWGLKQFQGGKDGSKGPSGKVDVYDLTFTKPVEKASCKLILHGCNGKKISEAVLTVRQASGDKIDLFKITMENAYVSGFDAGLSSGGQEKLTEEISLNFEKVKVDYKDGETGKPAGNMGWNIKDGEPYG